MIYSKKIKYAILRPSGNDTALVFSTPNNNVAKKILETEKNVEQVMFVLLPNTEENKTNYVNGIMAGGEMCVNATRALGYYLLNGKNGETTLKVSGINELVKVIVSFGNSSVYFNLSDFFVSAYNLEEGVFKIVCSGIIHLIIKESSKLFKENPSKNYAISILEKYNLKNSLASGVIFLNNKNEIMPFVYVKEIETLYYETACGSGSIASSIVLKKFIYTETESFDIKQPSGYNINVVLKNNNIIGVSGIVEILDEKYLDI